MSNWGARTRAAVPGLGRYPADVQARLKRVWVDAEVSDRDLRARFNMPLSAFELIRQELGPRPKDAAMIRAGFKPRSFSRG